MASFTNSFILSASTSYSASTKKLKGENRPINNEQNRALLLASMVLVDAVVLFDEDTDINEKEWLQAASKNEAFDFLNDDPDDSYI